ncbi:MAG: hypothetical protein WEB60_08840, partial [Terrimicrobiaceae bacterium]
MVIVSVLGLWGFGRAPAQDLQALFKAVGGSGAVVEREVDAEEQLPWARDQLAVAQKAQKEFDAGTFARQLEAADLPASRAEDLKSDLEATVRSYGAGIDALTAVIENRKALEAVKAAPPPTPPLDDKGVDELTAQAVTLGRDLASLETQMGLGESFLGRQKTVLNEASRELRRLNEEFDSAPATSKPRSALLVRLAEARSLAASSSVFAVSWRLYADQLELERLELTLGNVKAANAASGLDTLFSKSRAQAGLEAATKTLQTVESDLNTARENLAKISEELNAMRQQASPDEESLSLLMNASSVVEKTVRGYELWLAGAQLKEQSWRAVVAVANDPESTSALVAARDSAAIT